MTFFESYYTYAKTLPDEVRHAFYDAILDYAFSGVQPSPDSPAHSIFLLIKPNIDSNLEKIENGRKGGRKGGVCKARFGNANASGKRKRNASTLAFKNASETQAKENASEKKRKEENRKDTYPTPTPSGGGGGVIDYPSRLAVPTLDLVLQTAKRLSITEDFARQFYADMTRTNWAYVNHAGNTATVNAMCLAAVMDGRWRARKRLATRSNKPGAFAEQKANKIGLED